MAMVGKGLRNMPFCSMIILVGRCSREFEVSLGVYMIAFKYGLAKKWFGNPQLTYCKVLFGGM